MVQEERGTTALDLFALEAGRQAGQFKSHRLQRGGFLQVAVSEAPPDIMHPRAGCAAGAPDTALRPIGTDVSR